MSAKNYLSKVGNIIGKNLGGISKDIKKLNKQVKFEKKLDNFVGSMKSKLSFGK